MEIGGWVLKVHTAPLLAVQAAKNSLRRASKLLHIVNSPPMVEKLSGGVQSLPLLCSFGRWIVVATSPVTDASASSVRPTGVVSVGNTGEERL